MPVRAAVAGVLLLATVLYLKDLDKAPVYIGWDEARFALQGYAIATTGHDLNGHAMPLFFHNTDPLVPSDTSPIYWQPFLIYLIAAVLRVVPLSEWAVRLPVVALAMLNVWLMYAIARRIFANPWYAVLAAFMLALNPTHFIFGRMASDYFCPQTFALLWFWCLLLCVQTDRRWLPAATGLVLGAGMYSYIASWIVMPFYLAITAVVLWIYRKPARDYVALGAGFVLPVLLLIPWIALHPNMLRDTWRGYAVVTSLKLSERVALYWDYFNPSYLFFAGGSDPMWATRRAGVFLLAAIVLLPCGIWSICRGSPSIARIVMLVGFFFAPVPIVATLPEASSYAVARALLAVPFGVLICAAGVEWLVTERGRAGAIVAALLILSLPIQFAGFMRDYFGDYQVRSAFRFDYLDVRDVAAYVIASDASARVPAVYLSDRLVPGKSVQWKFHLTKHQRLDLWQRTKYFSLATFKAEDIPSGSLLVLDGANPRLNDLLGAGHCSLVHVVTDVADAPAAAILRKN